MGRVGRKVKELHLDVRNMFALQGHILSTLVLDAFRFHNAWRWIVIIGSLEFSSFWYYELLTK
jgi:hypothetical protein